MRAPTTTSRLPQLVIYMFVSVLGLLIVWEPRLGVVILLSSLVVMLAVKAERLLYLFIFTIPFVATAVYNIGGTGTVLGKATGIQASFLLLALLAVRLGLEHSSGGKKLQFPWNSPILHASIFPFPAGLFFGSGRRKDLDG